MAELSKKDFFFVLRQNYRLITSRPSCGAVIPSEDLVGQIVNPELRHVQPVFPLVDPEPANTLVADLP